MAVWKVCIKEPFLNCEKVYPIQQKKVKHLLEQAKQDTNIKKAILFGSSITWKCHCQSDVDIYFELKEDIPIKVKADLSYDADIWTNFSVDDRLQNEILKTGLEVYHYEDVIGRREE